MKKEFFENKVVLITGGTGSLGRALIRRLKILNCRLVVYSRDEGKQALLFNEEPTIARVIGDIRDADKLNTTFKLYKPDYVIHTAALKRIDDMELHPDECVKTNILGSQNVAIAAINNDVKKCILISTDKACLPVNVYGSSKFIAERIFTNIDYTSDSTIFSSVRYGNVIASRGSFLPLWLSLLKEGKKIDVTSLEMTRFLFTLNDAVSTVLDALCNTVGGEVFIPKISSYDMRTILAAVEEIHGASYECNIVGLRPGEKLHEDMLAKTELPYTYEVPGCNLLCVRPQYTKKEYDRSWSVYKGTQFNSALHINNNTDILINLIVRGTEEVVDGAH